MDGDKIDSESGGSFTTLKNRISYAFFLSPFSSNVNIKIILYQSIFEKRCLFAHSI